MSGILDDDMEALADSTRMKAQRAAGYEYRRFKPWPPEKREALRQKGTMRASILKENRHPNPALKLRDFSGGDA